MGNFITGLKSFARGVINIALPGQPGKTIFPISTVSTKPVVTSVRYTSQTNAPLTDLSAVKFDGTTFYDKVFNSSPVPAIKVNVSRPLYEMSSFNFGGKPVKYESANENPLQQKQGTFWKDTIEGVINLGSNAFSSYLANKQAEKEYNPAGSGAGYDQSGLLESIARAFSFNGEENAVSRYIYPYETKASTSGVSSGGAITSSGISPIIWIAIIGLVIFLLAKRS